MIIIKEKMLANITREQIFKMCYLYKKSIPNTPTFYIIFMFIKYISPYLITHNLRNFQGDSVLFDKVFKRLILFQETSSYYLHPSYSWVSITILCLLFLIIIGILIIFQYYKSKYSKTDLVIFNIPSTKININPFIKGTVAIITYICIILILFSQHIVEYLTFGIFSKVVSMINQENFVPSKLEKLKVFQRTLPLNDTLLMFLNLVTIMLLYICSFFFIGLSSTRSMKSKHGNKAIPNKIMVFWFILLFQFQGVYSINYYFIDDFRDQYRLYLCIVVVILFGLFNIASLRAFNFRSNPSIFFIDFMNLLCFISGIFEIIQYCISKWRIFPQILLIRTMLEIGNSLFIVLLIIKRDKKKAIEHIAKRIFNEDTSTATHYNYSQIDNPDYIISFHCLLIEFMKGKDVLEELYLSFILHFQKCEKDNCYCRTMREKLHSQSSEGEKKEIIRILSLTTERDIVRNINFNNQNHILDFGNLIILHIDYLYAIANNPYLTMYLCQYYLLSNQHRVSDSSAYIIYEIYRMNLEDIKAKKHENIKYLIDNADSININKHLDKGKQLKTKDANEKKQFLEKICTLDKIKKLLLICSCEYEKIMRYRRARRKNKPMMFTCKEFFNSVIMYKSKKVLLTKVLNEYLLKNRFLEISEECYLLNVFFTLFDGKIPNEYIDAIQNVNSFIEIHNDLFYIQNAFMILSLSLKEEFIIQYATTSFIEEIHYTLNEIIGSNVHNSILNGPFSEAHFAQMKMFLTNGLSKMKKESFVITKEKHLYPVYVTVKPLPSKLNLSMIISFKPNYSAKVLNNTCFAYLDKDFRFIYTSSSFDEKFIINSKMLNDGNISYIDLFGVRNPERIKNINRFNYSNKKEKWFNQFNKTKSIQTTVKSEDHYLYYNDQSLLKAPKSIIEDKLLRKNFSSALAKIKLQLEGSGLDKGWLKNIDELYNQISQRTIHPNLQYSTLKEIIFTLKLEMKRICNMYYFISTITENKDNNTTYRFTKTTVYSDKNGEIISQRKNFGQSSSLFSSIQEIDKNIIVSNTNGESLFVNQSQNKCVKHNNNNNNNQEQQMNDSNLPLFSNGVKNVHYRNNNFKTKASKIISQNKQDDNSNQSHSIKFTIQVLNYLLLVFYLTTFIVIIINIFVNSSSYTVSQDLFYINSNFLLLTADIFFGGIGCLRSCLIVNKILSGNYDLLQSRIKLRANDLIEHFHQLSHYINHMNNNAQIYRVYNLLYSVDSYSIMLSNTEFKERQSSFNEEVFQMYFFLSYFNPVTADKCRIKELFFDRVYNSDIFKPGLSASLEEKSLHYILSNIISVLGNKLSLLTLETNNILHVFINESMFNNVLLTVLILINGIGLNGAVIIVLVLIPIVFRINMSSIFDNINGEDIFFQEIILFKKLLSNFSSQQCFLFENKKFSSQQQLKDQKESSSKYKPIKMAITTSDYKNSFTELKNKKSTNNHLTPNEKNKHSTPTINEDNEVISRYHFNQFARMTQMRIAIFLSTLLLLAFIGIQIGNIIITIEKSNQKILDSSITISILSRVPKLGELILYSEISFISNNMFIMTKDQSEYNKAIVSNYYNVSLDLERESLFVSLDNSYYAFVYYQIYIARENIRIIRKNENHAQTIPITRSYDILFNDNENMCLYLPVLYIQYAASPPTLVGSFQEISTISEECRQVAGGINMSGLEMSLDLLLKEFSNLYIDIFKIPADERTIEAFFGNNAYSFIGENVQTTLKILHNVVAYLVEEDMIDSYAYGNMIEMLFCILSIIFSCVLIVAIILLYVMRFERYNIILEQFLCDMNASIINKICK